MKPGFANWFCPKSCFALVGKIHHRLERWECVVCERRGSQGHSLRRVLSWGTVKASAVKL